jgi:hypothetical protein
MKRILTFSLCLFGLAAGMARAEITVSATVSQAEVGVGQPLVYQVVVSGDQGAPGPQLPEMPDFQVSSRGTSQSISINNGAMSVSKSYTYILVPAKEGVFTIPPATVVFQGQTYQTSPIEIKVVPADQAPPPPQQQQSSDPFEQFFGGDPFQRQAPRVNALVRLAPSKSRLYVNEEFLLTQKLYYSGNVNLTGAQSETVDTTGFWAEYLPRSGRLIPEGRQTVNNIPYSVFRGDRVVLFPGSPGKKVIKPIKVLIGIEAFFSSGQKQIVSEPLEITVLPLPPGKPAGFNGAVGQYSLSAAVDKRTVKQNDAILLKVVVSGRGNVRNLGQLAQPDLGSFKIYKSSSSVSVEPQADYVSGRKTFEYILIPLQSGKITIPSFKFAYFDPAKEAYRTLSTDPIVMTVQPVSEKEMQNVRLPPEQVDIRLLSKDIRYIKSSPGSGTELRLHRSAPVRAVFALELLGLIGLLGYKIFHVDRLNRDTGFRRKSQAYARFRKVHQKLLKDLAGPRPSLDRIISELETIVTAYAADKLNIPGSELTVDNLEAALKNSQLPGSVVARYKSLLEEAQMLKYAPVKDRQAGNVRGIVEEVGRVVSAMEEERFA